MFMMLQWKNKMKEALVCLSIVLLISCKPNDKDIKKAIAVGAREQLNFGGINYTVNKGVVPLTGDCPSEGMKNKLVKSLQSSPGVKQVIDRIVVGPVLLDTDFVLKQKVDGVLAGYASVQSNVRNGIVQLSGTIPQRDQEKLVADISKLPPGGVVNALRVK